MLLQLLEAKTEMKKIKQLYRAKVIYTRTNIKVIRLEK